MYDNNDKKATFVINYIPIKLLFIFLQVYYIHT